MLEREEHSVRKLTQNEIVDELRRKGKLIAETAKITGLGVQ